MATRFALLFFLLVTSLAFPLDTVPHVDLKRYLGEWYEIASYPMFFQKGCVATKATYTERTDGRIDVLNECRKATFEGPLKTASGVAKVMDTQTNAKLKVRFFIGWGDYWIIDLDDNYQWAVVSEPRMKYLWILSRNRWLDEDIYRNILARLKEKGFDLSRLKTTPQPLSRSEF
ncbi:MAG: hypothetical protein EB078_03815 [Proteobacteria bacterium]|nr:hypothetical protein [Pseudomonadota bacterium]NDD04010.1 hypothetical protein [Pseudomonadota bacterium]NDG26236.1 hypothetical protein [Pseudomonadota bacterium]